MKPIEIHPGASRELHDAREYYNELQQGLGQDFRAELEAALHRIQENPKQYGAGGGRIRIAPIHRFPYLIYYEEFPDRIWIAAVGHSRRRPGYWKGRRPT